MKKRIVEWVQPSELSKGTVILVWNQLLAFIDDGCFNDVIPNKLIITFHVDNKGVRKAYILEPQKYKNDFVNQFDVFKISEITSIYEIQMSPLKILSCKIVTKY